jgi:hypothetical protein
MSAVCKSKAFLEVSTELLRRGYGVRFCAEGASMHRTIRTGEAITVEPVSPADLKSGDIALYHSGRGATAHRVVRIERERGQAPVFVMRGDAASSADEPVEAQQILGKVVAVERRGRSIDLNTRRAKMEYTINAFIFSVKRLFGGVRGNRISTSSLYWRGLLALVLFLGIHAGTAHAQVGPITTVGSVGSTFTTGSGSPTTTLTISQSVSATGTDTFLIVGVSLRADTGTNGSGADTRVSSISFGPTAQAFTCVAAVVDNGTGSCNTGGSGSPTYLRSEIWYLKTPSTSNTTITITVSASTVFSGISVVYSGVTGVTSAGVNDSNASVTTASLGPVTVATNGLLVDNLGAARSANSLTPNATQVKLTEVADNNTNGSDSGHIREAMSSKGGTSVTMNWTLGVASPWALVGAVLAPSQTTAVTVSSFTATQSESGNLIKLETGREVNNLGFNLYRGQNGQRVKLNSSLLAGTALLAGPETALSAGYAHSWWDVPPGGGGGVSYWVEEVDLHGQRTWYGPAVPKRPATGSAVSALSSVMTAAKGPGPGGRVLMLNQVGREGAPGAGVGSTSHPLQARLVVFTPRGPVLNAPPTPPQTQQYKLAAGPAVKIGIQSEGWYSVTQAELVAAGFNPNAAVNTLQLYAEGVQQPIYVRGAVGNKLGPFGDIEFYATGLDTTWSDTRVYWLTWGSGGGLPVQNEGFHSGGPSGPPSFPFTVEWKPRTVYVAALLNGDADNFFGPVLASGDAVSQPLTITNYYSPAAEIPQLQVSLQGVSDGPHAVGVALNGNQLGTVTFSDQKEGVATLALPGTTLQAGQNLLTLTVQGGSDDVSLVDNVQLTYPHSYTADSNYLRFTVQGGRQVTLGGFSNSAISVVDVTNPTAVSIVQGRITVQGGSYAITIVPQGIGTRSLLALTSAQVGQPASITANHPSSWHAAQAGFDMVMITHSDFASSLAPLVKLRQGQGRKVAVIDVEDLYDEFNFGEKTPYALKNFLSTAKAQWGLKPHFVLLGGDATFDPKNYLGQGDFDFVPTYLVDTTLLETASDDWFADFSGTGVPQMAVGRFPIRTAADASALVNKIVGYEKSGASGWNNQVLLVADQNDSGNDFEADAAAVKALLPASLSVSEIFVGSDSSAHSDLLNALNSEGEGLVNYNGHGSQEIWESGLFSSTDATGLTNAPMVPFVVSMTCLNGYFQDVYGPSLSKALINAPGGGALAVWASSGLTNSPPQATMNQALIKALYGSQPMTLGEAAATAKAAVSDMDVRQTWILFGDPATTLQ